MFLQCESRGIQLTLLIERFDEEGFIVDWIDFYEDSLESFWKPMTTLGKIETALRETKGIEHSEEVVNRLKLYMASKHK